MDKSWIDLPNRMSREYMNGIDRFLVFAYTNRATSSMICCPCRKCENRYHLVRDSVREHLISNGFLNKYKHWINHGESYTSVHGNRDNEALVNENIRDDMVGMIHDVAGISVPSTSVVGDEPQAPTNPNVAEPLATDPQLGPDVETENYFKLLEDAQSELYPGCQKFTSLSFIVRLLHMKVLNQWSDTSVTMLLELLNEAFPEGAKLPDSYYKAQKITTDLGFTYETWDACPNSCMLFRNEYINLDECVICKSSRWKQNGADSSNVPRGGGKQIPSKQMRYFPLKQRLQRLYMSSKTAKLMKWHAEERQDDGVLRHPADSLAWKDFDRRNTDFADDCRSVRLGLASDGFNPFRSMNIVHSTWPVVLIPYNLPPWMCMKQPFLILSTLIDGPKGPGDKIDVYMQPLIEELKELWIDGVSTFDASTNQMFQMHAALLWTISDFPAYANLSGWSTKGEYACPCCNKETRSCWLKHGRKHSYLGHRRFLSSGHKFRKDKVSFDGTRELSLKPRLLSGSEILLQVESEGILTQYRLDDLKERHRRQVEREKAGPRTHSWKKKSIFFELPYWEHNLIRHNLDVMHIEKNVCDNVLWTILGVVGKSKDNVNARRDLQEMNIRKPLHLQSRGTNKVYLPPAQFTMTKDEKYLFLKMLKDVRVPDGYSSNISRRVRLQDRSISGLKSHDSHILMQQLIPLGVRGLLPKNVVQALIELSNFFRQLCSKVNRQTDVANIQGRIALTLCHLEKIFPPAFFDIMEHLPVQLGDEALVAGAIQFRWMYPIERYLLTLKQYVRNRAHPEGSMAKGYLMEECMSFCSQYLNDVETKLNRPVRNYNGAANMGRAVGETTTFNLGHTSYVQCHQYILFNTKVVEPFLKKHLEELKMKMPRADDHQLRNEHFKTFHTWFKEHVHTLRRTDNATFSEEILTLANGPHTGARRFTGYITNGFRFRVKSMDDRRASQNSGVALKADTISYASRKDKNPRVGAVYYYGQVTDIIEIRYTNAMKYVLFKCDWIDNVRGKKEDNFKFTLINFNHLLYRDDQITNEPFILVSQAEQVWYVADPIESDWQVVVKMSQRGLFDMYSTDPETEPYVSQQLEENIMVRDEDVGWVREVVEGETVDVEMREN